MNNGYGNVWNNQFNVNPKWISLSFKQKMKDQYMQQWTHNLSKSSSGNNYKLIKDSYEMNTYFKYLPNYYCKILTAFRTGNHRLPIEVGRWHSIPVPQRTCQLCNLTIGDEFHYTLECKHFENQRKQFIKKYYYNHPNTIKFYQIFNTNNKTDMLNLSKFLNVIMKSVKATYN